MTDAGSARLEHLATAALALETALRELGVRLSDDAIESEIDRSRADFADQVETVEDDIDPLAHQGEIALAAVRRLVEVAHAELQGRNVVATKKCFRVLPAADVREIEGPNGSFWICEHIPAHREVRRGA